MRILLVTSPHPEASWLHKALQESGHSVPRADDLRDGLFLASQEAFDATVATSRRARSTVASGVSRANSSVMRCVRLFVIVAPRWCGLVTRFA